jgi:CheY-like chemotaxis protein
MQRKVKGTGLGLPLTRRLAELLGGRVAVESEVGRGSTFSLVVPACHPSAADPSVPTVSGGRRTRPVLAVDASPEALETYAGWLEGTGFHLVPASTVEQARRALEVATPAAIVLDVVMQGESGWVLLEDLASTPATRDVPVLVVTIVENREHALELGAADFARKPIDREWLVERLSVLGSPRRDGPLLAIDDDEVARYLLAELLEGTGHEIVQTASGAEGLRAARALQPAAIFLDLVMPEMSGEEVLDELRRDPATSDIPVVIYTSEEMGRERRAALEGRVEAILLKRMRERDAMRERVLEALERCGVPVAPGGVTTDE